LGEKVPYAAGVREELVRCGAQEVARTAHELGIGARDLASKGPHTADLLKKLLVALGADPKQLASQDPIAMRDLQRLCITCGAKRRCEHELATGTAAKNYERYCPNAYTIDALLNAK
jgi:Family of unknown function (DUF6455)